MFAIAYPIQKRDRLEIFTSNDFFFFFLNLLMIVIGWFEMVM